MPTPDEIREYREWRARIINGIWDAEAANTTPIPGVHTQAVLTAIGAANLAPHFIARLVKDLEADGLIEDVMRIAEGDYPMKVGLTPFGRMEVERWIAEDRPTELLPVTPSQVFNTHIHGNVTGSSIVVGSSNTTINLQAAVGESLPLLLDKARQLLAEWHGRETEREEVTADIELLAEHLSDEAAPSNRIRAALRRISAWAGGAAAVGGSSAISGEVQHLATEVLRHL